MELDSAAVVSRVLMKSTEMASVGISHTHRHTHTHTHTDRSKD